MEGIGGELLTYVHNDKIHRLIESESGEYIAYRISR